MFGRLTLPDHGPVFLNEGVTRSELDLRKMEALRSVVSDERREDLEQDIRLARAGVAGERKIVFELSNSHYPLVFIHDLCLEHEGTRAQIDFLVVTPYHTLVIECKNLVGDIEIDSSGSFVRTFGRGRQQRREGVYSPIAQNKRHIELMKAIRVSSSGRAMRLAQRFVLDDYYRSVVVLANEKTLLSADSAPKEVREQVIRADQLVEFIRRLDASKSKKDFVFTFREMEEQGARWLSLNCPQKNDLAGATESILQRIRVSRPRWHSSTRWWLLQRPGLSVQVRLACQCAPSVARRWSSASHDTASARARGSGAAAPTARRGVGESSTSTNEELAGCGSDVTWVPACSICDVRGASSVGAHS